ncbi:Putative ribonuclease H protein At1g65750, partial [Linum grandiflorum]
AFPYEDQPTWESPLLPLITHHLKTHIRCLLFGVACWSLWKTKNEYIFTDIRTVLEALSPRIYLWAKSIQEALIRDQSVHTGSPTTTVVNFSWLSPSPEWVAPNFDGSVILEAGKAAAGGLFRDSDGRCLAAYSMNLGICSITIAELRAVVTELQIAWERGYRRVQVQLDSRAAIQLLLGDSELTHQHSSEVASFREMLDRDWLIKVEHIYREGNRAADYLAALVHSLPSGVYSISVVDHTLSLHILYDMLGISQSRLIMNES